MGITRISGLDFALGVCSIVIIVLEISGTAVEWEPALGSYTHQIIDDLFFGFFLFLSGWRTNFIYNNVLSDGPKQLRYLSSRAIGVVLLGSIFYLTTGSIFLLHLALLLFVSLTINQLNSTILYFLGFVIIMLALVLPLTVSSSPVEAKEASSWWSDGLYLRNDSFIPISMYFLFGMIYGRSDFGSLRWQRFIRNVCLLVLGGTILTHFASMDYFKSSYFIEDGENSRLFPASLWVYRPIYILGSLPAIILLIQFCNYISQKANENPMVNGINRIGQLHLSVISIGLLFAFLLKNLEIFSLSTTRIYAWTVALIIVLIFILFRKQIKTAPVEWIIQRFY